MVDPQILSVTFECYILPRPIYILGPAIISSNGETLPHVTRTLLQQLEYFLTSNGMNNGFG